MHKLMRNTLLVLFTATMAITLAHGQNTSSDDHRRAHHHKGAERLERMAEHLDLTDQQQEKIKQIRSSKAKQQIDRQNQVRELRAQLMTAMSQDQVDKSQVNSLIEQIGELRTSGDKDRADTMIAIREVLTDEQRLIFDQHKSQRRLRHRSHRRRG